MGRPRERAGILVTRHESRISGLDRLRRDLGRHGPRETIRHDDIHPEQDQAGHELAGPIGPPLRASPYNDEFRASASSSPCSPHGKSGARQDRCGKSPVARTPIRRTFPGSRASVTNGATTWKMARVTGKPIMERVVIASTFTEVLGAFDAPQAGDGHHMLHSQLFISAWTIRRFTSSTLRHVQRIV
jgi:hypothetical protein